MKEPRIEAWLAIRTPAEEMAAVEELFRSEGITVEPRPKHQAPPPVGNGPGWYLPLLLASTIGAFFVRYFGAAGEDAWKGTKALIGRLKRFYAERYPMPPGAEFELELRDAKNNAHVFLRADMPDEAFRKLFELEFEPDTWYVWDEDEGEWVKREPGALGFAAKPRIRNRLRRLVWR